MIDIITDTNIFLAVALDEPEKDEIIRMTSDVCAIAPEILPYEIGNAFTAMVKRKQITHNEALPAFEIANQILVKLVSVDIQKALTIALEFNLSAYDAYFLQCAETFSFPLIALDKRMKQVAIELNIKVLEVGQK